MNLLPGDVLLYASKGLFGWIISVKCWHSTCHVEQFIGNGQSVASRDGIGTGTYPLRTSGLQFVCRPEYAFDLAAALKWFRAQPHQPYGWLDLFQFVGLNINTKGIVCSSFVTEFLRAGGLDPFNGERAVRVAPFEFLVTPVFAVYDYLTGTTNSKKLVEQVAAAK